MEGWQKRLQEAIYIFEEEIPAHLETKDYVVAGTRLFIAMVIVEEAMEEMPTGSAKTYAKEFSGDVNRLYEIVELLNNEGKRKATIKTLYEAAKNRLDLVAISARARK